MTRSYFRLSVSLVFAGVMTAGCAHTTTQSELDQKLAAEPVKTQPELKNEAGEIIDRATGLTDAQREQLRGVRNEIRAQLQDIWQQSLKLKSVLVKDIASAKYNEGEVELIRTRLRDLEAKKLAAIFAAVEKTNGILGRRSAENEQLIWKLDKEPTTKTAGDLSKQVDQDLKGIKGLTPEQKAQLDTIKQETHVQVAKLKEDSFKLRSILIKDLLSAKDSGAEVDRLKTRIKEVEDERLSVLFSAVSRTNELLGRWGSLGARERASLEIQDMIESEDN